MSTRSKAAAKDRDQQKNTPGHAKRDTLLLVAVVSLLVGFFAGMVFQAYRVGSIEGRAGGVRSPLPSENEVPEVDQAIQELEKEVAERPDSAESWARLGHARFDADRHEEAIQAYQRSLDIDATNADVWTDLGVMYRRSGRPEQAVQAFDRAMEEDPEHEVSRFNKGVVLFYDLQDVDGALEAWEGLLQVNPMATAPDGRLVMSIVEQFRQPEGEQ